jgi:hypothetical protein
VPTSCSPQISPFLKRWKWRPEHSKARLLRALYVQNNFV